MKKKNRNTGECTNIDSKDDWKEKFFEDNGSVEDQLIEQAESPTVYKKKIKDWIRDNPKPIGG